MKMTTTIASVNCYGGFLNTNPKILQTFFTYILEAQQFTLAKVTLNQVLSTQINSSRLDKVQNMPVEKILSADFFSLEFVKSAIIFDEYSKHKTKPSFLLIILLLLWEILPLKGNIHMYLHTLQNS